MAAEHDRISITIGDLREEIESHRTGSAWKELSIAGKIRSMIRDCLEPDSRPLLPKGPSSEDLDLLIEFLNYLIDHGDHDGYSLSEISGILGRPNDKGLLTMVQKLAGQNPAAQNKKGAQQH